MLKALILKLAYYITIRTLDYEDERLMTIRRNHRYNVLGLPGPSCFWDDDFTRCTKQIITVRNYLSAVCDNPEFESTKGAWDGLPQLKSIGLIRN
tara:strand:- start:2054 stop:2338 length:285 start_codon:yes stop_codon:yes gene_type:complete